MQKTKLGISTALLSALAYFTSAFGGYSATLIVCGYILLFEGDRQLRKSSLNALLLMVFFSAVTLFTSLFGSSSLSLSSMISPLSTGPAKLYTIFIFVLNIIPKIILSVLGIRALIRGKKTAVANQTESMQ